MRTKSIGNVAIATMFSFIANAAIAVPASVEEASKTTGTVNKVILSWADKTPSGETTHLKTVNVNSLDGCLLLTSSLRNGFLVTVGGACMDGDNVVENYTCIGAGKHIGDNVGTDYCHTR